MDFRKCFIMPFNLILSQPVFLVPAVIPIIVNFLILIFGGVSFMAAIAGGGKGTSVTFGSLFVVFILILISMIAEFIAHGMLVHMTYAYESTGKIVLENSLKVAWEKIGSILLAAGIVSISAIIGFMFFIIPGLIVLLFSVFTVQEIIINSKEPVEAIKGSIEIVKTHFGNVLGYFILLVIIVMAISGILSLIPVIGALVATLITTPYTAISVTLVYLELTSPVEEVVSYG